MAPAPTSLRVASEPVSIETAATIRPSVTLKRASAALDCDESTVRRMVGNELEGHRLRSGIRVYVDSIEAYQRDNHLGRSAPPPAKTAPPTVTQSAEFRGILAGLQELGLMGKHGAPQPARKRRRA